MFPVLTRVDVNHVPKGVVGMISPWNYPFTMALATGSPPCSPATRSSSSPTPRRCCPALLGAGAAEEAGIPAELWQVVAGAGPGDRPRVIDRADYVCFTGSTATGRLVGTGRAGG